MTWTYQLAGGRGNLTLSEEGTRVRVRAQMPSDGRGLYKVWLLGGRGKKLLGTLVPEGQMLTLSRVLSRQELEEGGCWPPEGANAEMAFPFQKEERRPPKGWRFEASPERLMGETMLAKSAKGLRGALLQTVRDGFCLAFPYRVEQVFPMTPLFCFAELGVLDGRQYLFFKFNGNGCPIF